MEETLKKKNNFLEMLLYTPKKSENFAVFTHLIVIDLQLWKNLNLNPST